MKPTIVFKQNLGDSIDSTRTALTGIAHGYYKQVADLIKKYSDSKDEFSEWEYNDILNDELYRLSTLISERNRLNDEIDAIR